MKILILFLLLSNLKAQAQVSFHEFLDVKKALALTYDILNTSEFEFSINTLSQGLEPHYWWNIPAVHASYVYSEVNNIRTHHIYLIGGLARLNYMTPDGLALIGCHEIGHGLGGGPRKRTLEYKNFSPSVEGQADYFATKKCLNIVFDLLIQHRKLSHNQLFQKLCNKQNHHLDERCKRLLEAISIELQFLNSQIKDQNKKISFLKFSKHIQTELNLSPTYYPDGQCRIDTMINGVLGLKQPECWFPGGEVNGTLRETFNHKMEHLDLSDINNL